MSNGKIIIFIYFPWSDLDGFYARSRRSTPQDIIAEAVDGLDISLYNDIDAVCPVVNLTKQAIFVSKATDERTESDSLNKSFYQYFISLYNSSMFFNPSDLRIF